MILQPPHILSVEGPVVFLAGPIQGAPDWQKQAIHYFKEQAPTIHIASPRRDYLDGEFIYAKQVDWETHFLNRAALNGVVLFYLAKEAEHVPGRAYAQTTRFELGEWKAKNQLLQSKLVVGIEDGFTNAKYIKRRLSQDCPSVPICSSLLETCQAAIELIQ